MPPPRWPVRSRCISESPPWTKRDAGRTRSSQAPQWPRPSIPSPVRRSGLLLEANALDRIAWRQMPSTMPWTGLLGGKCLGQDRTGLLGGKCLGQDRTGLPWTGQDRTIRREVTRSCCKQRPSASDACPERATMLFSTPQ